MVKTAGDYQWSSWHEYAAMGNLNNGLCCMELPFSSMSKQELCTMVLKINDLAEKEIVQLEQQRMSDKLAMNALMQLLPDNVNVEDLKLMSKVDRRELLRMVLSVGVGKRQLSRLTGVDYSEIRRL